MNIEKNFNNSPLKFADILDDNEKVKKSLENIDGLYELLSKTVYEVVHGKLLEEESSSRIKKIARDMVNDKEVKEAVMAFLSEGGKGYRLYEKGAVIIKKDLEKELKNI
ncbi:hypothetical protein KAJ61_02975 [Candidatus Parcubacteria bacterium]|nr:hypothetical protein [Candidatus Parcubacteria bacterium]